MSDSWEGQLGAEAAGQPSEKTPDFIPGWFARSAIPQIREAVRISHPANFPLSFLHEDESVSAGPNGVTLVRRGDVEELAVPFGNWIVRQLSGLTGWKHEEFTEQWHRQNRLWVAPADRPRLDDVAEPLDNEATPPWLRADEQDMWQESRFDDYRVLLRRISNLRAREGRRELEDRAAVAEANRIASSRDTCQRVGDEPAVLVEEEPDRPDAEILDGDGHSLGGLEVVIGAADGVPYVSLADLEHVFANLYEDITDRQAKKDTAEKKASPLTPDEVERIEKQKAAAVIDEEHRVDAEDDRPLWRVELDYGLNHLHNAVTDWLGR